jgi:hypothetical protein
MCPFSVETNLSNGVPVSKTALIRRPSNYRSILITLPAKITYSLSLKVVETSCDYR